MATSGSSSRGGRLSTTNQFRSSSTDAARERPAPLIPVMMRISGWFRAGGGACASSIGTPAGTVPGFGSVMFLRISRLFGQRSLDGLGKCWADAGDLLQLGGGGAPDRA